MITAGIPKISPFRDHTREYEEWFTAYPWVYDAELRALSALMPPLSGKSLEVGVGSGKFAKDLGIYTGLDPCPEMLALARGRGVRPVLGMAESLPFASGRFELAVMITVLCFLNDPATALAETRRVMKEGGHLILAFIDRQTPLGRQYLKHQADSVFYRQARFYAADEVAELMARAGFVDLRFISTISRPLAEMDQNEPLLESLGQGAFVVARGVKE